MKKQNRFLQVKEKEIYATPIYKGNNQGKLMDELNDSLVYFRRPEGERQQEKENLIAEITLLGRD